jgi:hypothetical protein
MNKKLIAALVFGVLAQLVYADPLNDCLYSCLETYKQCVADPDNQLDKCKLDQKNCEGTCRSKY